VPVNFSVAELVDIIHMLVIIMLYFTIVYNASSVCSYRAADSKHLMLK